MVFSFSRRDTTRQVSWQNLHYSGRQTLQARNNFRCQKNAVVNLFYTSVFREKCVYERIVLYEIEKLMRKGQMKSKALKSS